MEKKFTKKETTERAKKLGALKGAQSVRKKKEAAQLKKFKNTKLTHPTEGQYSSKSYLSGFTKSGEETQPLGRPRKKSEPKMLKSRATQHDKDMAKAKKAGDVKEQKRLMSVKKSKEANIGVLMNRRAKRAPKGDITKKMNMGGVMKSRGGTFKGVF